MKPGAFKMTLSKLPNFVSVNGMQGDSKEDASKSKEENKEEAMEKLRFSFGQKYQDTEKGTLGAPKFLQSSN